MAKFRFALFSSALLLIVPIARCQPKEKTFHLIIGTYTSGKSEGIYVYSFNSNTGKASHEQTIRGVSNPSYIAISKDRKFVYSVTTDKNQPGAVIAFSFNAKSGLLKYLNQQSSGSSGPCYVSVDKTGKFVFVANYGGGSLAALAVRENGSLDSTSQHLVHSGHGINKERQEKSHVHSVILSPDNKFLLSPDLGTDKVMIYKFDSHLKEPLLPADPPFFEVNAGSGPRHLAFDPTGKFVYLVQEMSGIISAFSYLKGTLKILQNISMLKPDFKGEIRAADIHVSPDGKFLYASNRGDANEVVIYRIDQQTGMLAYIGRQTSFGISPRNFMIDPTGNYLLVANEKSDDIFIFKRNKKTGLLSVTGNKIEVGSPVCLIMTPKN